MTKAYKQPNKIFLGSWVNVVKILHFDLHFDFQSQFWMSKIIWIFLKIFFIKQYQFKSTFFVIDFSWKLQFLKDFIL